MRPRNSRTPKQEFSNKPISYIVKCKNCSTEILKKDLERHEENFCHQVQEFISKDDWNDDIKYKFDWTKDFGSLLINKTYLISSMFHDIPVAHLPTNISNLDQALFLSNDLMNHLNINNGQNVILYLYRNKQIESLVYSAYRLENVFTKSSFTICLKKGSDLCKTFLPVSDTNANKLIIDFDISIRTIELRSIYLEYEKHKTDVFKYLTSSCMVQNLIQNNLIIQGTERLTFEKTTLKIVQVIGVDDIETKLENMTLFKQKNIYQVTSRTKIIFSSYSEMSSDDIEMVGYEEQFSQILKLIQISLEYCEKNSIDLQLPRSILLTGPTGTGKTIAMKKLFKKLEKKMNLIRVHASIFLSKKFEFERLENFFDMFVKLQPSVLFLDNLEDVSNDKSNLEKRVVSWLKVLLDSLPKSKPIFVIGACIETELLDSSLRRPGRFDLEIDFPIPSPGIRKQILESELRRTSSNILRDEINQIAESTHGFTGADLKHLCDMARLYCLNSSSNVIISFESVLRILKTMKPSVMREISLEKPNIFWKDIGGMQHIRHLLEEIVVWPIKHPEVFNKIGIEPPRGILMYGPPGCCKTMIGKALATESGLNFFSIKGPELFSKWVGESERAIREIFRKARAASPSILFFDEIDALAAERGQKQSAVGDRVLAQLLTEIDGVEKLSQVVIIAATNRPDIVDKALLRPGRLDSMVYVPLPCLNTRREILKIRTEKMPLDSLISREEFIDDLAIKSAGYTGAEVTAICQTAGLASLSENIHSNCVKLSHFDAAFMRVRPRIDKKLIDFYEGFSALSQS